MAIGAGHLNIKQNQIRFALTDHAESRLSIACHLDLTIDAFQARLDQFPVGNAVVYDEHLLTSAVDRNGSLICL
jgi:hypothetical protein